MTASDREDLRRRLYRPGARAADVTAYLAVAPPAPEEAAPPPPPPRRSRRRSWIAGTGVLAATVVLLLVVRTAGAGPQPAPAPVTGPTTRGTPLPTAGVDPPTRFVLVRNLLGGHDAGFGALIESRIGGHALARVGFAETHGLGDAVVPVPQAPSGARRLIVLLVLAQDGAAGWSTDRVLERGGGAIRFWTTSEHAGALRAGVPTIGRLDFTAATRPDRVVVTAPADAGWGLALLVVP